MNIDREISQAAYRRYMTDAEFHARVDLAVMITAEAWPDNGPDMQRAAAVALFMASQPLPVAPNPSRDPDALPPLSLNELCQKLGIDPERVLGLP